VGPTQTLNSQWFSTRSTSPLHNPNWPESSQPS
jgi:hypothetical protein